MLHFHPPPQQTENMDEEPSRVLHFRNVTPEVSQADLQGLCSSFGKVENILLLRDKNQALVQMDSIASASQVMNFFPGGQAEVAGTAALHLSQLLFL